jgi:hypothetical protein
MYEVHEDRGGILKSHLVGRPPARGLCTTREEPQSSHWLYPSRFEQHRLLAPTCTQPHQYAPWDSHDLEAALRAAKVKSLFRKHGIPHEIHDNRFLSQKTTEASSVQSDG